MILAALILLTALQVADAVTTVLVIRRGGYERNPIMAWLMARLGMVPALVVSKAALIGVLIAAYDDGIAGLEYVLVPLCAVYAFVVANNVKVLRRR